MSKTRINGRNVSQLTYQSVQVRLGNAFHRTCAELKRDLPSPIGDAITRVAVRAAEAWAEELRGQLYPAEAEESVIRSETVS